MFYCIGCILKLMSFLIKTLIAIVGLPFTLFPTSIKFILLLCDLFSLECRTVLGLVYPLYASVRALESRSQGDDKQWLTYWVIYSLIALIELTFYSIIQWIPMWSFAKLILTSWLVLPGFSGASHVYEKFVRPYILRSKSVDISVVPPKKEEENHLPTLAGKYTPVIEEHISWADTSAKYIAGSVFDDDYTYY